MIKTDNNFKTFLKIREEYAKRLPDWIAEYESTGNMHQDPYFMDWQFTPIEGQVWGDIRSIGVPFYPQMPVMNYFLDFGNPFLKIGIECDGLEWHNSERDKARDARLAAEGWMIYRIEGHKCNRFIDLWEMDEGDREDVIEDYFMLTSEGVISAIQSRYFDDSPRVKYSELIAATLRKHRSTPETNPYRKRAAKKVNMPVLIGDTLEDYWETLVHRMRAAA